MKARLSVLLLFVFVTGASGQLDQRIARSPKVNYDWRTGFISITELTGAFGVGLTRDGLSKYYYGITSVAGYQFTRNIMAGGGVGAHIHEEKTLFPLYLDIRFRFNAQEVVPFFAGTGGIMFDFTDLNYSRVFINPSAGLKYIAANRIGVSFSAGMMVITGGPNDRMSFANLKLGLDFKGRK